MVDEGKARADRPVTAPLLHEHEVEAAKESARPLTLAGRFHPGERSTARRRGVRGPR